MSEERAVFVVGVGRSGTSLLQSMLAVHSELAFPPETGFLRRYGASRKIARLARGARINKVAEVLKADQRLQRTRVAIEDVLAHAEQAGSITDLAVYRSLLTLNAIALGKPYVGDKDPRLIEYLDLLQSVYPEADVVHIIRDPRDVLASKKKADWSRKHSVIRHVLAHRVQLTMGRRAGVYWFGRRYHEIAYESLLNNPEAELRKLCDRLAFAFESSMLKFSTAAEVLVAPEEVSWKRETLGPLLERNAGKWRNVLSIEEVALVERCCVAAMCDGNYQNSDAWDSLTFLDRVRIAAISAMISIAAPIYITLRRSRNWLVRRKY